MKISRITATTLEMPRLQHFTSSLGVARSSENAIVEVETDVGITGLGEASTIWDRKGRGASDDINHLLAELLVGQDPRNIRSLSRLMDEHLHRSYPAKAGVEMALYDILGKALNAPVYMLLGGLVRERIALSHSLSMDKNDEIAAQAAHLAAQGYRTLKMKIGRDPDKDRQALAAVRQSIGYELTLRVDANMGWLSAKEAVRQIKALEEFDLELVEQPLHFNDMEGLAFVRSQVDVPIMADESVWTPADAMACIKAGAVDVFNVYVAEAGGLGPAADIFALAEAARLPCIIGSMPEFGIGTAAQAHLAFAMRNLGYASDINGCVYHSDDIINETLPIDNGYILPPLGPGLGVSLNQAKVAEYRI